MHNTGLIFTDHAMYTIPAALKRRIGKAIHDYDMFGGGDRVLLAISGGIDSLVLASLLATWQRKAPVDFELKAIHIDHGFWHSAKEGADPLLTIGSQLSRFSLELQIEPEWKMKEGSRSCYLCARNRRSQLFAFAREHGYNKIALGHHKDDLIETFLLNTIYSGNISTMIPKQELFNGTLSIVRPMAYLEKDEVLGMSEGFDLQPVKDLCPLAADTKRERVRGYLQTIYADQPGAKNSIFAALSNIRNDYLLRPVGTGKKQIGKRA